MLVVYGAGLFLINSLGLVGAALTHVIVNVGALVLTIAVVVRARRGAPHSSFAATRSRRGCSGQLIGTDPGGADRACHDLRGRGDANARHHLQGECRVPGEIRHDDSAVDIAACRTVERVR